MIVARSMMDINTARHFLAAVVMDCNDIRDGFKAEKYSSVLARALMIIGAQAARTIICEGRAKAILDQAHAAAAAKGFYGDLRLTAHASAAVLEQAAGASR